MSQAEPPAKKARTQHGSQDVDVSWLHEVKFAVSSDKASRQYMEDVWVANQLAGQDAGFESRLQYFGVFDGHGGKDSATYAASNLHKNVIKAGLLPDKILTGGKVDIKASKKAVVQGFLDTDTAILKAGLQDGAAAVALWVIINHVLVANIGDAKCVLARYSNKEGDPPKLKALTLTKEHLAIHPAERARIEKQGGFVSKDGRLNGRIQVARGFGDAQFKQSGCTATPDITAFQLTEHDRFLICACDGFWRVFDAQGAVDLMQQLFAEGRDEKAAANRILHEAVRERKCNDNCTVMVIRFHRKEAGQPAVEGAEQSALKVAEQPALQDEKVEQATAAQQPQQHSENGPKLLQQDMVAATAE